MSRYIPNNITADYIVKVQEAKLFLGFSHNADLVEVVRCKDCKYITKDQIADEIIDRCVCFGGMIDVVPDGFCSYGDRREE